VGVDCYWCQACGDRYWIGNLIALKCLCEFSIA
jgi:hypothetical protein